MEEILASIRRIIADDQSLPGRGAAERDAVDRDPVDRDVRPPVELRRTPAPDPVDLPRHEPAAEPLRVADHASASTRLDPAFRSDTPHAVPGEGREQAEVAEVEARGVHPAHGTIAAPQYAMPDRGPATHPEAPGSSEAAPHGTLHDDVYEPAEAAPFHAAAPEPASVPDVAAPAPAEPPPAPSLEAPSLFSASTDSSVSAAFNMLAASRLANNSDELMNLVRDMIRPLLRSWLDDNLPSMVERMVRAEIERVARGGR